MESTDDVSFMTALPLKSNITTISADKHFYYERGLENADPSKPILVLIHGYPQTNFMWRHLIPLLPPNIPLFVPDIPGYGRSAPLPGPHDKRSTGTAILNSLRSLLPHKETVPIILVGHDRGARICHRLAVDRTNTSDFNILGVAFLDIVPTLIQWQSCINPLVCMGSFHWSFLANVEIATTMIKAQGGDAWVRMCLDRWIGKSPAGLTKFKENDAIDIYAESFKHESVIRASCDDYRAGAMEDSKLQVEDQKEGRKVDVDVLAIYSAEYLGRRYDVRKVWEEWMGSGNLEVEGIREGVGHFVAEEAPEKTAAAIVKFYNAHVRC